MLVFSPSIKGGRGSIRSIGSMSSTGWGFRSAHVGVITYSQKVKYTPIENASTIKPLNP